MSAPSASSLPDLRSLQGIQLRTSFDAVRARLGTPSTSDTSPISQGDSFGSYVWRDTTPPIAVLTWVAADGEFVWGVRVLGEGPADPGLGFGVGSPRSEVFERFPDAHDLSPNDAVQELVDGNLVVKFASDVVVEIRLQAPMGSPKGR